MSVNRSGALGRLAFRGEADGGAGAAGYCSQMPGAA